MTKQKFLNGLKEALTGELSATEINNQLLYYEKYIEEEVRKGKAEKKVLEELGEPRLIAKTIIEAQENTSAGSTPHYYEDSETSRMNGKEKGWNEKFNGVLRVIWVVLLIVFVLAVVFSVIRILLPIVIPVILILLVVSLIRRRE